MNVGVVGCGLMGSGIAQVCAEAGHPVIVREVSEELLRKGLGRVQSFLEKGVQKGKLTPERMRDVMSRLEGTTSLEALAGCDLVIEAVVENLDRKREVYQALDRACGEQTIFASNTSSLSITEMAATTKRTDRFVGLHFFNPVPLMKLVEVVRGPLTSDAAFEKAFAFAKSLGKTPIRATDKTGFIVTRLLVPYLLDAIGASPHPPCSSGWSRPGCTARRRGRASTTTRRSRPCPRRAWSRDELPEPPHR